MILNQNPLYHPLKYHTETVKKHLYLLPYTNTTTQKKKDLHKSYLSSLIIFFSSLPTLYRKREATTDLPLEHLIYELKSPTSNKKISALSRDFSVFFQIKGCLYCRYFLLPNQVQHLLE